jgi:hypothetical protein
MDLGSPGPLVRKRPSYYRQKAKEDNRQPLRGNSKDDEGGEERRTWSRSPLKS